jgi:hypothetical protein
MVNRTGRDQDKRPEELGDKEGYDEAQRAEIIEAEGRGPTDGTVQTDIPPDFGGPDPDEDEIEDEEDELGIIEDTDEPFLGGAADEDSEEADEGDGAEDVEGDDVPPGIQGNEDDTNRKDTQNTTDR